MVNDLVVLKLFGRRENIRKLREVIDKFRRDGAVSLESAKTVEELGLPLGFKDAMKRRLGKLGIFVETNGKYYLSEERLKMVSKQFAARRRFTPVKEREVIKEIVKVRCRYCGALNLQTENKCSNCGANL